MMMMMKITVETCVCKGGCEVGRHRELLQRCNHRQEGHVKDRFIMC